MQKKKIVMHLINSFEIGGAEKLLVDFAEHFSDDQISLILVYFKGKGSLLKGTKIEYKTIDLSNNGKFTFRSIFKLIHIIRKEQVDAIHVHDPQSGLMGRIVAKICQIKPVIATRHITKLVGNYPWLYWIENRALKNYSCVIVNSHAVQKYLCDQKFVSLDHCKIVYNGIDMDIFSSIERKKNHQNIIIGTVARLQHYKGIDILIRAFALVQKECTNIELRIMGDGRERVNLEKMATDLNITPRVKFIGSVEKSREVVLFLNEIDIFVLPSRIEGFGISLVEAMAMALPVIGSAIDGIKEVINDGVTGLLFESENIEQLSEKIIFLIKTNNIRNTIASMGSIAVHKKFTIESNVKEVCNIYHKVLRNSV